MNVTKKVKRQFILVIVLAVFVGLVSYPKAVSFVPPVYNFFNKLKINLGLDLQGGIHLEYKADTSQISSDKVDEAMQAVQDVIERRVNAFGVAEPTIYTTKSGDEHRLVVELAGVKDIEQAKDMIKETPFLEFKEEGKDKSKEVPQKLIDQLNEQTKQKAEGILKKALAGDDFATLAKENSEDPGSKDNGGEYDFVKKGDFVPEYETAIFKIKDGEIYPALVETQFGWHIIKRIAVRDVVDPAKSPDGDNGASDQEFKSAHILLTKKVNPGEQTTFVSTGLTGKNLKSASVEFASSGLSEPQVSLQFDAEGTKLFADITKRNLNKKVAIYLDNEIISAPVVQTEIENGQAVITGSFSTDEANKLARRLIEGALPVPISLISQQSVEASLGQISLAKSLKAGIVGLVLVIIFMIFYYRFLGVIASIALLIYAGLMIAIFKLSFFTPWQITLTLPGIAGFVLSIGMAVDANILIFERTKEEIRKGRDIMGAIEEGFRRAWTAIFDGNVSSVITALVLIEMGTGFVKGFAVTLIIGVLTSMFTAIVITRTMLRFLVGEWIKDKMWMIAKEKDDKAKV